MEQNGDHDRYNQLYKRISISFQAIGLSKIQHSLHSRQCSQPCESDNDSAPFRLDAKVANHLKAQKKGPTNACITLIAWYHTPRGTRSR
jgi:hypothetical protein